MRRERGAPAGGSRRSVDGTYSFPPWHATERGCLRLQEVHHRIALLVAASTLEMDRHIAIGTHGNGVSAPKICRSCGGDPGSQLASGVGMRANQGPNRQQMRVVEDNRAVDAGQFDQLPLLLDGTGLLADGDVFNRTSDQDLSAGPVRDRMAVAFPGRAGCLGFRMLTGFRMRSRIRCSGS